MIFERLLLPPELTLGAMRWRTKIKRQSVNPQYVDRRAGNLGDAA